MRFVYLLIWLITLLLGYSVAAQPAPDHVGNFYIGRTTIADMRSHIYEGRTKQLTDAASITQMRIKGASGPVTISSGLVEIVNHGYDSSHAFEYAFPEADGYRYFFIDQLMIEGQYVNNLFMHFRHDTLMRLLFTCNTELGRIYADKYPFLAGRDSKEYSGCIVKGRKIYNTESHFQASDSASNLFCHLSVVSEYDKKCVLDGYIRVLIINSEFESAWADAANAAFDAHTQERRRKLVEGRERKLKAF